MTTCNLGIDRSVLRLLRRKAGTAWQKSRTSHSFVTVACHPSIHSFKRLPGSGGPGTILQKYNADRHLPGLQTRSLSNSSRCLARPTNNNTDPDPQKSVVQQTKDLRKTIQTKLSQNLTHENIYNLPNALTLSRLVLTPVIGYLVLHDQHAWAVGLFVYAGTTDLVDGWIARKWKLQTVVGSVIDPMADKLLMTVLTVCLALKGALPMYIATLILGRDVSLAIAAIYYRWASLPAPRTLARYWDFSLPSAEVHPTTISKYNTALQLMLIGATTAMPLIDGGAFVSGIKIDDALTAAQWIVAGTTVWSGASYLYTRNAVKILGEKTEGEKKAILKRGRRVIAASFASCLGLALYLES
ncbi:hypothetical protein FH972_024923 [Carpinus fangiana]|uniref:CDP-diacylglycerol--glycerol-3-phosphate 3-phosphatidyltransferase n=1 Tax=Carpinus fangiana TaxID=176857 RepID=A0A5N6KZW7_9ROSI|nr:hypothetical protein FH972_024923 [Carpinus fangiana]